jgi:hypothetical protein
MNRFRRLALSLFLTSVAVLVMIPARSTANTLPPPGGDTVSYPYSVTKSGSTITARYKFDSGRVLRWIRISIAVQRTGGGAADRTWYKNVECWAPNGGFISSCTGSISITDVSGKQNYWFTQDTSWSGTGASTSTNEIHCLGRGVTCSSTNVYY